MRHENIEFIALFEASGWSKAEVARKLDLDRSSVGKFVMGQISPSSQTLKLFKMILAAERPEALLGATESGSMELRDAPAISWEQRVIEDLRHLNSEDRQRVLNVMRAMIRDLPKREASAGAEYGEKEDDSDVRKLVEIAEKMADKELEKKKRRDSENNN